MLELAWRLDRGESRAQAYSVSAVATATLVIEAFPASVDPGRLLGVLGAGSLLCGYVFARLLKGIPAELPAR